MNERLVAYNLSVSDPTEGSALGTGAALVMIPFGATLVYASVSPFADDTGATMDIQIAGADIVTAVDAADREAPGEWISTHCGGANTPIAIAAGSQLEIDLNSAAAGNRFDVTLLFLTGETWG